MTDAPTIVALAARLEQLEARNAALEAEVRALRSAPSPRPGPAEPSIAGTSTAVPGATVGRRSLLTKGLAVAGAVAAGAVLLEGAPAAASDGSTLVLGATNTARARTTLRMQAGSPSTYGHAVEILDVSAATPSQAAGLAIVARGDRLTTGADISSLGIGMSLHGTAIGLRLTSSSGTAADISSSSGRAMTVQGSTGAIDASSYGTLVSRFTALNSGGTAVEASATTAVKATGGSTGVSTTGGTTGVSATGGSIGVTATSSATSGGFGVQALVTNGIGVQGYATTGSGLKGRGSTYGVIAQSMTTDPTEAALFASAIDGMGIGIATDTGQVLKGQSGTGGGIEVSAPRYHLRLFNDETRAAPTGDTIAHQRGDLVESSGGDLWLCTANGTPGTWRKLAGPATAGAFHVLAAPARAYDSRPGLAPTAVGPKTPFAAGTTRTFDLKAGGTGVPAGATAVMVNLLLVNAAVGNGNATIWANGAAKPIANTLVWGGSARRFSALAVTTVDAQARCQVNTSLATDLVIDVVGYYR